MDSAIAALVLVEFAACGYSLPDKDGVTRFEPAPNIERVHINPDAVSAVVKLRNRSEWFEEQIDCVLVYAGGEVRTVRGTEAEVIRKLQSAAEGQ